MSPFILHIISFMYKMNNRGSLNDSMKENFEWNSIMTFNVGKIKFDG